MLFEQNINPAVFSYTANGVPQLQIPVKNQWVVFLFSHSTLSSVFCLYRFAAETARVASDCSEGKSSRFEAHKQAFFLFFPKVFFFSLLSYDINVLFILPKAQSFLSSWNVYGFLQSISFAFILRLEYESVQSIDEARRIKSLTSLLLTLPPLPPPKRRRRRRLVHIFMHFHCHPSSVAMIFLLIEYWINKKVLYFEWNTSL